MRETPLSDATLPSISKRVGVYPYYTILALSVFHTIIMILTPIYILVRWCIPLPLRNKYDQWYVLILICVMLSWIAFRNECPVNMWVKKIVDPEYEFGEYISINDRLGSIIDYHFHPRAYQEEVENNKKSTSPDPSLHVPLQHRCRVHLLFHVAILCIIVPSVPIIFRVGLFFTAMMYTDTCMPVSHNASLHGPICGRKPVLMVFIFFIMIIFFYSYHKKTHS